MSPDRQHSSSTRDKIVRMANQIGTFFMSKPHAQGVAGVAEHINKFWDPRMRRQFFEIADDGGAGLSAIVIEAVAGVRRPGAPEGAAHSESVQTGSPDGKGPAAGEATAEIAASQG